MRGDQSLQKMYSVHSRDQLTVITMIIWTWNPLAACTDQGYLLYYFMISVNYT